MKHLVFLSTTRLQALVGALLLGWCGLNAPAAAQAAPDPYYSKFATPAAPADYSVRVNGLLCVACGVASPERAADDVLTNYATIQNSVGVGNRAALRLRLTGTAAATYRIGVVVGSGTTLNVGALSAITLRTYANGVQQQSYLASASGVTASTLADGRTQLSFLATLPADQVEVDATIVANVLNSLDVYYAYAVPANVVTTATGYLSRLTTPSASDYVASTSGGLACVGSGITSPLNAVSASLTDYATTHVTGVGCTSTLQVRLENAAPAGYQAGFVIGSSSLLDVNVLSSLKIKTYNNGVLQETGSAANLLQLNLLPDGKYQVSFQTSQPFDHVELEKTGVLGLLDDLNVYYGFGIEPRAFRDQTPVLSNFSAAQTTGNYQVNGSCTTSACLASPDKAADNVLTDYAQANFALIGGTRRLKLRLNGDANAGNRAGVVLSSNNGLLSTSLLGGVTVRTYAADGTTVLESVSGSNLLTTGLLGGTRQEVGFMTTQDFEWVEVELNNSLGLFNNVQIYYAFADDPVQGFPTNIVAPAPLPVVLTSFRAQVQGAAVVLNWQTAQEQNSSYFAVERARNPEGPFVAVGRVTAAGNSTRAQAYSLRDAEVAGLPAGVLYYRLRQVDVDGTTALAPVVPVQWAPRDAVALSVYPNPASETAAVRFGQGSWPAGATLRLYTTQGELVQRLKPQQGDEKLSLRNLRAGLYQVVLVDARGQRLAAQRLSVVR